MKKEILYLKVNIKMEKYGMEKKLFLKMMEK